MIKRNKKGLWIFEYTTWKELKILQEEKETRAWDSLRQKGKWYFKDVWGLVVYAKIAVLLIYEVRTAIIYCI